jgi:hypothetical protein
MAIIPAALLASAAVFAQELEPRAYSVSPVGTNILFTRYGRASGHILFDPSLPVEDVTATVNTVAAGYSRALDFFGRSANLRLAIPYVFGHLSGVVEGQATRVRRSGLADSGGQLSVNLYGAPAMDRQAFARYRQRTNIFTSFTVVAPLGQYDPPVLVNIGTNRWTFRPQVALSQAIGRWYIDVYAGAWLFTTNRRYLGSNVRKQQPISSYQTHVAYAFRRRFWAAASVMYFRGGNTVINGIELNNLQSNLRYAATLAIPLSERQSVSFQYGNTPVRRFGSKFDWIQIGYAYLWMRR